MATIEYVQTNVPTLYEELGSQPHVGWRGYLYRKSDTGGGTTLFLQQSWDDCGAYLFAPAAPTRDDFVQRVAHFLSDKGTGHDRILLWLADADADTFDAWKNAWFIAIEPTRIGGLVTKHTFNFNAGNLTNLKLPIVNRVQFDERAGHILLNGPQGGAPNAFEGSYGGAQPTICYGEVYVPFGGADGGTFRFRMEADEAAFYQQFDVGIKYFYNSLNPQQILYPLCQAVEDGKFSFNVSIDPVDVMNRDFQRFPAYGLRTFIAFEAQPDPYQLNSFYRTQFGHPIQLSPVASANPALPYAYPEPDDAMFVYNAQAPTGSAARPISLYLGPQGHYRIHVPTALTSELHPLQLMCGLSGAETVVFLPESIERYGGDRLHFRAGQCAFAPDYPFAADSGSASTIKGAKLLGPYHTSWVSIQAGRDRPPGQDGAIRYLSQPDEESLFRSFGSTEVLEWYQPTVVDLTEQPAWTPLLPLAGLGGLDQAELGVAAGFELQIAANERKRLIDEHPTAVQPSSPVRAVTPQGLLLLEDGGNWEELTLARGVLPGDGELKIGKLAADFRKSLQSNQQFIVLSLADNLWQSFQDEIHLDSWPFRIRVPDVPSGVFRNVMILKFGEGTVADKVGYPMKWTNPGRFNDDSSDDRLNELSRWLTGYCADAILAASGDPDHPLAHFAATIQDPAWNGILALKVDMPVTSFPLELAGLLGGMDFSLVQAHHLGIRLNRPGIGDSASLDLVGPSSLFGYLDYKGGAPNFPTDQPFGFHVSWLKARFCNSKLASFDGEMKLRIGSLFDNDTIVPEPGGDMITLLGSFDRQNDRPVYSFCSTQPLVVLLPNKFLTSVTLVKASFQTLDIDGKMVRSRFSLSGTLSFTPPSTDFPDLFSFGAGPDRGTALTFDNLGISMTFNLEDSFALPAVHYSFDANGVALDVGQSLHRKGSLLDGFPLRLSGFMTGKGTEALEKAGYIPIDVSTTYNRIGSETWYGLDCQLDLGGLGELTSPGSLTAKVALCWSGLGHYYIGIAIPGLRINQKQFALEEWIDTEFDTLDLDYRNGGYTLVVRGLEQRFIGHRFTPSGGTALYLFKGNTQEEHANSLGWYAAYKQ